VKQLNYDKALCSIIVTTKLLFDCLVLLEENCLPTILEICQNKDCFFLFCDTFLSRIVVFTVWRDNYTKQKVSGVATVLDKAFAYLFIENCWDEWSTIFWRNTWVKDLMIVQLAKGRKEGQLGKSTQDGIMLDRIRMA